MKVQTRTGLVALRPLVPVDNRPANVIAGYNPKVARDLLRQGLAEEPDLPKGVKYIEVAHTVGVRRLGPDDPEESRVSLADKLGPIQGGEDDAPAETGPVEIPDDWETLQALRLVQIAKKIEPGHDRMKADEAKAIITAEIDRRKAAK